jgi:hypothetical protein
MYMQKDTGILRFFHALKCSNLCINRVQYTGNVRKIPTVFRYVYLEISLKTFNQIK